MPPWCFNLLLNHVISLGLVCVLWQALGCLVGVPSVGVCQLLDQLISLFCFYNGCLRLSYQVVPFVEECALFRAIKYQEVTPKVAVSCLLGCGGGGLLAHCGALCGHGWLGGALLLSPTAIAVTAFP